MPDGRFDLPDDDEGGGLDIRRYIGALFRYKWLIIGLAAAGLLGGAGLSRFTSPVYEAQSTIQILGGSRQQQQGPIQSVRLFEVRGWIELVRSFEVLDEVVRRRRLFVSLTNPADSLAVAGLMLAKQFAPGEYVLVASADGSRYTLERPTGEVLETATAGDSVGRSVGFEWVPAGVRPGARVPFRVVTLRDAAVSLQANLQMIPPPPDGSLLRMQLRGTDPRAIAATVNAVADRFVELATRLKREDLTNRTQLLGQQVERSQAELTAADNALEGYRVGTITLPGERGSAAITPGLAETRDPVFDAFFKLKLDRDALVNDRDAIVRALRSPEGAEGGLTVSLGTIPSVRSSSELTSAITDLSLRRAEARRLGQQYTSEHLPLRQLEEEIVQLERGVVRGLAQALVDNLNQRIADLDSRIGTSSREMQQIPPRVAEEARRRRDFESARDLNAQLRAAFEQARLAELSAAPDVRVLDVAVPPTTPVIDQLLIIIAAGLLGGLGLGIVLALLLDHFDNRIRYPEQVTRELGLQILGALPLVTTGKDGQAHPEQASHLLEALRSIRMNLVYAHGTAGTFITTVTSPGAGEGKSFLCSNLAKSFADSGHRTLLIDADTRRGALHRALGGFRKPGLLDFLSGSASLEQIVQTIPHRGIDFIGCGTRLAGGPELLSSSAMAQLLMGLRTRYSVIIVDSPPLGAGVDPLVLGALCGSMVLVLRNGVSDKDLAESRMGDLQRLPVRLLGAVLNDVKTEGAYKYYSYLPGYRAEDEVPGTEDVTPAKRRSLLGRG